MHQSQLRLRFSASVRWLLSFNRILQIRAFNADQDDCCRREGGPKSLSSDDLAARLLNNQVDSSFRRVWR